MNNRGQAALEYLMTYGWALIVIAIVVGVLVFIVSSPTAGVACNSSDPTKMLMKSYNVGAGASPNTVNLQNITGGTIIITATARTGSMTKATINPATSGTVTSGNAIQLTVGCGSGGTASTCAKGYAYNGTATITYTDAFGYTGKSVVVTCQGTVV